jgi:predicted PurR-regulated permease PerM
MYGKSKLRNNMNKYLKLREELSILSYFVLFLFIASIMFAFFFTVMARPLCKLKNRMNNTETNWSKIRNNITKINYGDSQNRVTELIGQPDETYTGVNKIIFSYQKYGVYKPNFYYEIEFRKDTLFQIIAHE